MRKKLLSLVVLVLMLLVYVEKEVKQAIKDQEALEKAIEKNTFFKKAWIKKKKNTAH